MPSLLRWLAAVVLLLVAGMGFGGAPAAARTPPCCTRPSLYLAYRIMPLGDSITAGSGSTTGDGYRGVLGALIHLEWVGSQLSPAGPHEGHSGWTCDQLADRARGWVSATRPAYVLLDCGTNDDGLDHTAAQMLASMDRLLGEVFAGGAAVVLVAQITLTPLNTPLQQSQESAFNAGLPALAAAHGRTLVVDMTGVHISPDRVHPDDAGYQDMAARWRAAIPVVRSY